MARKNQKAPGRMFLLVTGILMVIFSGLVIILCMLYLPMMGMLCGMMEAMEPELVQRLDYIIVTNLFWELLITLGCGALLQMLCGIVGIVCGKRPHTAVACCWLGTAYVGIMLAQSFAYGFFNPFALFTLILPALYLTGAVLNLRAQSAQESGVDA